MPRRLVLLLGALGVGALFVSGLFTHGVLSGALLTATDLVLIGLATVTWPALRTGDRVLRLAVIVLIAVVAAARFGG